MHFQFNENSKNDKEFMEFLYFIFSLCRIFLAICSSKKLGEIAYHADVLVHSKHTNSLENSLLPVEKYHPEKQITRLRTDTI